MSKALCIITDTYILSPEVVRILPYEYMFLPEAVRIMPDRYILLSEALCILPKRDRFLLEIYCILLNRYMFLPEALCLLPNVFTNNNCCNYRTYIELLGKQIENFSVRAVYTYSKKINLCLLPQAVVPIVINYWALNTTTTTCCLGCISNTYLM